MRYRIVELRRTMGKVERKGGKKDEEVSMGEIRKIRLMEKKGRGDCCEGWLSEGEHGVKIMRIGLL